MNNSKIALENLEEGNDSRLSLLQKKQGEITQLVEAIQRVQASNDWQKVNEVLFDGLRESLERSLRSEAEKDVIDAPKIYRLQGQLLWARRYADLGKLVTEKRKELESINNQIKHESSPRDGAL